MIIALYWYLLFLFIWDAIRTFENVEKQNAKLNLGMFDVVIDTAKGLMPFSRF